MTEVSDPLASEASPALPQASAGALIRQARESAGVHVAALAVALKVPVKKLEALETDQHDLLLDAGFVRALAASVCRTLGVDSTEILQRLPQNSVSRLGGRTSMPREPYAISGSSRNPLARSTLSRPAVMGGLALVVGAALLVFLPPLEMDFQALKPSLADGVTGTVQVSTVTLPLTPAPSVESSQAEGVSSGAVANATTAVDGVPVAGLSPVGAPPVSTAPAFLPEPPAKPVTNANVPSSALPLAKDNTAGKPTGTDVVVFKPSAESWVEVRDATGAIVLRRRLAPSEVVGASGTLPLSVTVGRADATQVQVRGVSLDLMPLARENVARFKVK